MDIDLVQLLTVLGRVNPAIWDAIIPQVPRYAFAFRASKASQVELNPQPIPPGHELHVSSALVAQDIALSAVAAEAAGSNTASKIVSRAVDEWCGTRAPHLPIPWPGPWPFPWPGDHPEPYAESEVAASRVVGALSLASVAARLSAGEAREALTRGAEKLLQSGLSG
jgi:hypothetical protein